MSDRDVSLFSREDDKAVIIALGKANNEGHTSTVYCLEVIGDFRNGDCHVLGKPFRLHNGDRYIWCNQKLRDDRLKVGSIVLYRESEKNGFSYHRNTGEHMEINKVLSQLQFGEGHYSGIAYRGIEEASPKAVINQRGISQEDDCKFVLISIKYGFTYDERIVFRTQLDELCDVKLNCRKYKRCQVDRENLPVSSLSSEEEVGGVVLLKMEHQTVCEGILLRECPSLNCYKMSRSRRGICCIINNAHFKISDDRCGAAYDERALVDLFERELSFKVHIERDLKFDEMRKVAIKFSKMDHSEADAFVMIIMSHGNSPDVVYGVEEEPVRVEDLTSKFTAAKCPTLTEKPKIFFIQACRGSTEERTPIENCINSMKDASLSADSCVSKLVSDSALPKSTCPREADFLMAFGTSAGYVSWRDESRGSLFIQSMVDIISQHHKDHHLLDMLTEVNKIVIETGIQVPAPSHTLRGQVWL